LLQASALAGALGATLISGNPARAQTVPLPITSPLDGNLINLATGHPELSVTELQIGMPGNGGLIYRHSVSGFSGSDYLLYSIVVTSTSATVQGGNSSETFTLGGGVYTSDQGTDSKLVSTTGTYVYTNKDGIVITFDRTHEVANILDPTIKTSQASSILYPSGEMVKFWYSYGILGAAITSKTNNYGYQIKYNYGASPYGYIQSVQAINNAIDYCDPTSLSACTGLSLSWPSVSYSYNSSAGSYTTAVTDSLSRTTQYVNSGGSGVGALTAVITPGGTGNTT
jgi:hypothetical protein